MLNGNATYYYYYRDYLSLWCLWLVERCALNYIRLLVDIVWYWLGNRAATGWRWFWTKGINRRKYYISITTIISTRGRKTNFQLTTYDTENEKINNHIVYYREKIRVAARELSVMIKGSSYNKYYHYIYGFLRSTLKFNGLRVKN